jgi:hypothetical protein
VSFPLPDEGNGSFSPAAVTAAMTVSPFFSSLQTQQGTDSTPFIPPPPRQEANSRGTTFGQKSIVDDKIEINVRFHLAARLMRGYFFDGI